jgi:hypothetical protein
MTTDLRQLAAGQSPYALVNALFEVPAQGAAYAIDYVGTTGLTLSLYGGMVLNGGTLTVVDDQDALALTGSATNYVDVNFADLATDSGIVINTTAHNTAYEPLYAIVCGASSITSITLARPFGRVTNPRAAIVMASDANKTLTSAEAQAQILSITSSVSLGATRNIVVPLMPRQWTVANLTTGSQSLQFIGATGTGITVANAKRAILYSDGTNVVRVTADQ